MSTLTKQKHLLSLVSLAGSLALLIITSSCQRQEMPTSIVRVSPEYDLWREDSKPYLVSQIPSGDELILDATGYEFDTSPFMYNFDSERGEYSDIEIKPNTIEILVGQIIIGGRDDPLDSEDNTGEAFYYRADWNSSLQRQSISAKDFIPIGESPPLSYFEAGQEIIISIGYLERDPSNDEEMFYSFWSGLIDIQE